MADWVPLASLLTAVIAVSIAFLKSPPVVPASRVASLRESNEALRKEIEELRAEIADLREQNRRLSDRVQALLDDSEYWRRKYQETDQIKRP